MWCTFLAKNNVHTWCCNSVSEGVFSHWVLSARHSLSLVGFSFSKCSWCLLVCYQPVPHAEDWINPGVFLKICFPRSVLNVIFKIFRAEFSYVFSPSWRHKQNVLSSTRWPVCVSLVEIDLVQIQLKFSEWSQIHACVHACERLHWST